MIEKKFFLNYSKEKMTKEEDEFTCVKDILDEIARRYEESEKKLKGG